MNALLPDALAKAGGRVLAELHAEWRKDLECIRAEHRAEVAELKADVTSLTAELKDRAECEMKRVAEALAKVKDGAPGVNGKDGAPGKDGIAGKDGKDGIDGKDGAPGERGEPGLAGKDGRDGTDAEPLTTEMVVEALYSMQDIIAETTAETVKALYESNPPKDGRDGVDGKDGELGLRGEKGDPGADGSDGEPGRDGRDAEPVTEEMVVAALGSMRDIIVEETAATVTKLYEANPPKDGPPGVQGEPGIPGRDGQPGGPGSPGRDGADGIDGKDGMDGLGFEDMDVRLEEDERTVVFTWSREGKVIERSIVLSHPVDRGVYKDGAEYQRGDGVTYGGSYWIAKEDTSEKPDGGKGWRMALRRARDGKDGKNAPVTPVVKV